MNVDRYIDAILSKEQGFVDHPSDRGGPTNWGITQVVARSNGYEGDMANLPESVAREIYRRRYIVRPGFDKVALINERIAAELIDTGVNMGPARAGEFLQRALNGMNRRGSQYADLFVDGQVGEISRDALRKYLRVRGPEGERVMVCALNVLQGGRYFDIAEDNESQEDFLYGWIRARVMQEAAA